MSVSIVNVNYAKTVYSFQQSQTSVVDKVTSRQDVAATSATVTEKTSSQKHSEATIRSGGSGRSEATNNSDSQMISQQHESFLSQLMEQMLANRIGLDKQKYDEIKQEIEEIELEKAALAEQEQSPARDSKIALLEDKQAQLNNALVELVEQAKRNREQNERTEQAKTDLIDHYRTAAFTGPKTALIL